jgi:hypothetical protein
MCSAMTNFKVAALAAVLIAASPIAAVAQHGAHPAGLLFKIVGAIRGQTHEIDMAAMEVYQTTPRLGSCAERRDRLLRILPDALRFSRYARDIAEQNHESEMESAGLVTLDLGSGGAAYFEAAGRRYAEIRVEPERNQVVITFRGTRLSVGSDVSTDVLSFVGVETAYYGWASALVARVAREHSGMEVVVTGQSLGGGLVLYSVLQNPGVKGFAFNPAGLSLLTWARASTADRARTNSAVTVISTRNARHIEPVTAISLAGRSVLPGHIFVLEARILRPSLLHSATTVVAALEEVASANAQGTACDGDLGELAH